MSTPNVVKLVQLPSGSLTDGVTARLKLVASTTGEAFGYGSVNDIGGSIPGTVTYSAGVATITWTSVTPNASITPANTYYEVTTTVPGVRRPIVETITVPDVVGPVYVQDILSATPTTLPATVTAANVTPQADGAIPTGQPLLATLVDAMDAGSAVDIVIVGDSILELSSWGNKLGTALAATYNTNRCSRYYHGYSGFNGLTSSTGTQVLNGASGQSLQLTAGQSVAVTPVDFLGAAVNTTSVTVVYRKSSGAGDILVKRAGSTIQTISTANGSTVWSNIANSPTTSLGSYEWTFEASGGTVVIEGVYFNSGNESAGVRVWQMGTSGYDCSEWSTLTTVSTFVANLVPDAYVIALGTNDTTETVVADMTTLYTSLDAATTGRGCIVVPYVNASCLAADVALIRGLVTTLGCPSWDHAKLVGSVNSVNDPWSLSGDNVHPDENLSWAMADQGYAVLSGDPIGSAVGAITRGPRSWQVTSLTATGAITTTGAVTAGSYATTGSATGKITAADSVAGSSVLAYNATADAQAAGGLVTSTLANIVFGVAKAGIALGQGGASLVSSLIYEASTGVLQTASAWKAKHLEATGATGAASSTRLIGRNAAGSPASGTWSVGDIATDANGKVYLCTVAGTPGTWTSDPAAAATTTSTGSVELATDAEAVARADTSRAIVPANLAAAFPARGRAKSAGTNYLTVPCVAAYATSTVATTANRRYYMPVYFDFPADLDQLVFEVTTGVAGNARIGVAVANEDWQPTSIVYDSGNIDVTSTGVKTASPALTDLHGRYLFLYHSDVGATVRVIRGGSLFPILDPAMGSSPFVTTLYKSVAYAAFDTTNWDTTAASTVGMNHMVLCRITDPSS